MTAALVAAALAEAHAAFPKPTYSGPVGRTHHANCIAGHALEALAEVTAERDTLLADVPKHERATAEGWTRVDQLYAEKREVEEKYITANGEACRLARERDGLAKRWVGLRAALEQIRLYAPPRGQPSAIASKALAADDAAGGGR